MTLDVQFQKNPPSLSFSPNDNQSIFFSRGISQDSGRVAIHEANLDSLSQTISKFDFNTNAKSVITIVQLELQNQNNIMNRNSQDAEVQQQQELTLNDIIATLTRMTSSMEGIKKRMEKLDIVQQKVGNLATRIESMKKKFIEIEKSQDFQAETLDTQGSHIAKILAGNKNLKKENTLINRTLNDLHEELELEKIKRNQLKQYGRREILEISGIPVAQDENCTDIVYNHRY